MTILEFFIGECENIFYEHKNNLIERTAFTEKKIILNLEEYSIFKEEFEKLQAKISKAQTKLMKSNKNSNIQEILDPIAKKYILKFINLVDLSEVE